jgi:hypothetical protein
MAKKSNITSKIPNMAATPSEAVTDHQIHIRGKLHRIYQENSLKRASAGTDGNSKISRIAGLIPNPSPSVRDAVQRRRVHKAALRINKVKVDSLVDSIAALEARIITLEAQN